MKNIQLSSAKSLLKRIKDQQGPSSSQPADAVREELDSLRAENRALRSALTAIEGWLCVFFLNLIVLGI